jgi:DAPG hydrolase PhiG domain
MPKKYLGYSEQDMQSSLAGFYHEEVLLKNPEIAKTLSNPPLPWGSLKDLDEMTSLEKEGYFDIENGYSEHADGSIMVAAKTDMPDVTPAMWDWWFGWHGSQDLRYKLWHPGAHLSAVWQDGRADHCYVGRNSIIREYIGPNILDAAIQFKSPLEFGFSTAAINCPEKAVYICAKIGHPDFPVDYGYLVHQVRATPTGAEMRSRFW